MAQQCSICLHKNIRDIDQAIIKGVTSRQIASQFGVGYRSVQRHKDAGHIPASIAKAEEAKEIAKGDDLLRYVKGLLGKSIKILDSAEHAGDLKTSCSAIREARGCLELLGKVTGELSPSGAVNVQVNNIPSLTQAPEWAIFIRVIERHPEIRDELQAQLQDAGL